MFKINGLNFGMLKIKNSKYVNLQSLKCLSQMIKTFQGSSNKANWAKLLPYFS